MISEKIKNIKDVYKYGYDDIAKDLFATCLKECNKFRRTTGSFKTTAFQSYIEALENILTNENIRIEILCDNNQIEGQLLRILKKTLSKKDKDRIISEYFNKELLIAVGYKDSVDNQDNNKERFYRKQLLAWLIATNKLEIRFATPKDLNKLIEVEDENSLEDEPFVNNEGMYHSKNGYFQFSGEDEYLVFTGSGNESITGHKKSDETFSVFKSWEGSTHSKIHKEYIDQDWTGTNPHIAVYKTEKETLDKINVIAPKNFPKKPKIETEPSPESKPELITDEYKYRHQSEAVNIFLEKRNGILEMATGTGKTNTALKIINIVLHLVMTSLLHISHCLV